MTPGTVLQVKAIQFPHHDYREILATYDEEQSEIFKSLEKTEESGSLTKEEGDYNIEETQKKLKALNKKVDSTRYHVYVTIVDNQTLKPEAPAYHELPYNTAKQKVMNCVSPDPNKFRNIPLGDNQQHSETQL